MPIFKYKAYNTSGREVSGELEAVSAKEAVQSLKKDGLYPKGISSFKEEKKVFRLRSSRVTSTELATISSQLSTLLSSGATLYDALSVLINEVESRYLREVLIHIKESISEGSSLARALEDHPEVFPEMYNRMVEAGESVGALDKSLARLSEYLETRARIKDRVRTALLYPALMTFVGIGVLSFLVLFVIPKITRIFEDTQQALPLITVVLLGIVGFFRNYWPFVLIAIGGAGWGLKEFIKKPKGKAIKDNLLLRLPWLGKLIMHYFIASLARMLGSLLESGIPMLNALEMTKRVLGHTVYERILNKAIKDVTEGGALSRSLEDSKHVPGLLTHMIAIGEKSGNLDNLLLKAAETYEREFETSVARALSLLEPFLILAMGLVVGFIVLAILLPIFQLNQIIR
jgi:general secretion pathway protein F